MSRASPMPSFARWAGLVAFALAVSLAAIWLGDTVRESWFLGIALLIGLAVGSLGLLMIGHLLGDLWLEPIRSELEAASLTIPLITVLAIPLAFGLEQLYPWAADGTTAASLPPARRVLLDATGFLIRSAVYLTCWTALALWISRTGHHLFASAIGLALLAVTVSLAAIDWFMSREPPFWSTLYSFAFAVSQLLAALAAAIAITLLRPGRPEPQRLRSLERALLTLAILVLWVWFAQYIVIWLANLPEEAAWYVARRNWAWLKGGFVLPAMGAAILILVPPGAKRWQMLIAALLILGQHVGHMVWLIRPAALGATSPLIDVLVLGTLAGISALWLAKGLRQRPNLGPAEPHARRPHQRPELSPRVSSGSGGLSG